MILTEGNEGNEEAGKLWSDRCDDPSDGKIIERMREGKGFELTGRLYFDYCLNIEMNMVFRALDDGTRRAILDLLRRGDLAAGAIADHFEVSKPTISHHLDLLKQADLILAERRGQFIVYSLNTSVVDDCIAWLVKLKEKGKNHEKAKRRMAATRNPAHPILRRRAAVG